MTFREEFDIVFIIPSFTAGSGAIWKAIDYRFHSPGVLALAAYIRSNGYKVKVFDCNLEQIQEHTFIDEFAKRFKHISFRYFGFSSTVQTIKSGIRLAEKLKKVYPETKIVFGGAHATSLPSDVLKNSIADYVITGEGELSCLALIRGDNPNSIDGLAYKSSDKREIIINKSCPRISDLNSLPLPAYDLVPMQLCKPLIGTYKKIPATIMVTSRGCIGKCLFCSRIIGNELALQSPERIIEEVKLLYTDYNFRQIIFYDDTFISNRDRISVFCEQLKKNNLKISWTCSSRVDLIDLELLKLMKSAGCHQIMYGVESFDKQVLKNINKNIDPEDIFTAIKTTKKAGIEVRTAIMVGNPGDTAEILKNNIKQLKKLNPDLIQVAITTPLPGSALFKQAERKNAIRSYDWDLYNGSVILTDHENLSDKELKSWYYKTYLLFYLRPRFILRQIFKLKSFSNLKIALIGFLSLFPILFRFLRR